MARARSDGRSERQHFYAAWRPESWQCGGRVTAVYAREGAAGSWVKVGEVCRRCGDFWEAPGAFSEDRRIRPRDVARSGTVTP